MNLDTTIKSKVESATGYPCYALEKPLEKSLPCTVYTIVNDKKEVAHGGDTGNRKARVQFTVIASTYSAMKSVVALLENGFIANTTDFQVSLPLETRLEDKEDNQYYSISEYYIRYNI